jgi:hypothetical protein
LKTTIADAAIGFVVVGIAESVNEAVHHGWPILKVLIVIVEKLVQKFYISS